MALVDGAKVGPPTAPTGGRAIEGRRPPTTPPQPPTAGSGGGSSGDAFDAWLRGALRSIFGAADEPMPEPLRRLAAGDGAAAAPSRARASPGA
jgi:hypothetical protein